MLKLDGIRHLRQKQCQIGNPVLNFKFTLSRTQVKVSSINSDI